MPDQKPIDQMVLLGIDVHPDFQAGLDIEAVRREGFDFMAAKVSEGTTVYHSQDWLARGKACGLLCLGYHYLRPGNELAQAWVFAGQLLAAGVPGMLDAEALSADGKAATLTVGGIHRFLDAAAAAGARVPLLYLPHWYWQLMGCPDLSGLPPLWGSSYPGGRGYATDIYEAVTPIRWAAYGGLPVAVLQFTDQATVAGQHIDANAFPGTREQLAALLGATITPGHRKDRSTMDQLPATAPPTDPDSDPATWPQRNYDIAFDVAGGWEGEAAIGFGGQDWPGRTTDRTRSFLYLASWMLSDGTLVPVDATHTAKGGGQPVAAHTIAGPWQAPHGAIGATLNYAAPGGGYVATGRST
jgi:lysozyme